MGKIVILRIDPQVAKVEAKLVVFKLGCQLKVLESEVVQRGAQKSQNNSKKRQRSLLIMLLERNILMFKVGLEMSLLRTHSGKLQNEDKDVSTIKQLIESNSRPDTTVMSFESSTVKALWSQRQKLVVENDLLYRKWDDEKGTTLQAIVPLSERRKILSYSHDHPTAGHLRIREP